jgi:hypothetical protein
VPLPATGARIDSHLPARVECTFRILSCVGPPHRGQLVVPPGPRRAAPVQAGRELVLARRQFREECGRCCYTRCRPTPTTCGLSS